MFLRGVNSVFRGLTQNGIINNRVIVSHRHFSTLYINGRQNIPLRFLQKNKNKTSIGGLVNARNQSTQSSNVETVASNIGNTTDQVVNTGSVVENVAPAADATNIVWESTVAENLPAAIPDVPAVVQAVETLNALGEPTFASLGLNNYSPLGLVQASLEFFHVTLGLPWYASFALGTVAIRLLIFPLVIKCQKNAANTAMHMPEIAYLQKKMTDARRCGDLHEAAMYAQELMRYTKENNVSMLKGMMMPLIQAPIFLSFFWGIRGMLNAPVESLKTGGLYWFTDLSQSDPYYILPILTSATMYLTIKVGSDSIATNSMNPGMRLGLQCVPVIVFPFIMNFEGAILCYWLTTNMVSLVQTSVLQSTKVRNYLGLPPMPKKTPLQQEAMKSKGFKKGFKEAMENMKIARDLRERETFDQAQFRRAGRGPLVKTYPIDHAKQKSAN